MSTKTFVLGIVNVAAAKLLGEKAESDSPRVSVSTNGSLIVDRDSLHNSQAYEQQLNALLKLETLMPDIKR